MASGDDKIGQHHFKAMARQGLAELRAAVYADSNVAQPPGYGVYGNPTPQEIVKKPDEERDATEARPSVIDERMGAPASEPSHEQREPPEPERE